MYVTPTDSHSVRHANGTVLSTSSHHQTLSPNLSPSPHLSSLLCATTNSLAVAELYTYIYADLTGKMVCATQRVSSGTGPTSGHSQPWQN